MARCARLALLLICSALLSATAHAQSEPRSVETSPTPVTSPSPAPSPTLEEQFQKVEQFKPVLDLLSRAFAQEFHIKSSAGPSGLSRFVQEEMIRKCLDPDGFVDPAKGRALPTQSSCYLLCIWITGTESGDRMPDVLVRPIIAEDRKVYLRASNDYIMRWTLKARARLGRIPGLPYLGRWDLKPVVLNPDDEWRVIYPKTLRGATSYDKAALPRLLRFINAPQSGRQR